MSKFCKPGSSVSDQSLSDQAASPSARTDEDDQPPALRSEEGTNDSMETADPDRDPAPLPADPVAAQNNPRVGSSSQVEADVMAAALAHTPISEVPRAELQSCFPWTQFYLQNVEYRPQAIICRGNLRSDPSEAYERVRINVDRTFGGRFLVVLQEGFAGKPFFALVPNPAARRPSQVQDSPLLSGVLFLVTLYTTLSAGAAATGIPLDAVLPVSLILHPDVLIAGIPYALTLLGILGCHELARYGAARRHQMPASWPYFIPVPFALGTFGAFVRLKGPVPNRKVLFDLSIAGPVAGSIGAVLLLLIGLGLSVAVAAPVPDPTQPPLMSFQQVDPTLSVMLGILAKVAMGANLQPGQFIDLHPMAFAAWLGLVVISLNLMPIGQLDGGHIAHAVYGQQTGANVGRITRLLVLLLALTVQPWLWIWALLLFFISSADEPALNDVTELNEARDLTGLVIFTMLALIVLPMPPFLQGILGLV
jgi:membrane-associated protease RseP (regulator of RpoE activity)